MGLTVHKDYSAPQKVFVLKNIYSKLCFVSDTTIVADSDGRKIVPAGSLVGSIEGVTTPTAMNPNVAVKKVNGSGTEGILLHSVDITNGDAHGGVLFNGVVDYNALPVEPTTTAITALAGKIMFIKGGAS